jgi:hypothetical protein
MGKIQALARRLGRSHALAEGLWKTGWYEARSLAPYVDEPFALHDRETADGAFACCLPLVERAASDERNFVKKGVSCALRSLGRRSRALHARSVALARRLAGSSDAAERRVGKDALRDLTRPTVVRKLT